MFYAGFCSIFLKNAEPHVGKQLSYLGLNWSFGGFFFKAFLVGSRVVVILGLKPQL